MAYQKPLSRGKRAGGYTPVFGKNYRIAPPNGRTITITPAVARAEAENVAVGFRGIQINGGRDRPASLNRLNHAVLFHPDYLQNYVGGSKPFSQFTREECRGAVQNHWDVRNGYGIITSGAQEGRYENDPWAQLAQIAPQQYVWVEEKWAELAAANPGTIFGGCYDGVIIINPGSIPESAIRQALTSPSAAHAFMLQYESADCPYFRLEMWRFKMPLINQYHRGSTNSHLRAAETRLTIRIVQLALQHVGRDPEEMMLFLFLNKSEFTNYTTRHRRSLAGGGDLYSFDFTNYSAEFMRFLCFMVRKVRHVFCWEDTQINSEGTAVVPVDTRREGDNFLLIHTENSNAPKATAQVSPFNVGITYPCIHSPKAGEDMAGMGALWYQDSWAHVPKKTQNATYRVPGGNFVSLDAQYDYDRYKNNEVWVELAEDGINYVIIVEDFINSHKAENTIEVQLSTGEIKSVTYPTGTVTAIKGQR